MKKLILLFILAFTIQITSFSQSCLPEGITFSTQAEIDNFQTNYPGCAEIEGDVAISGSNITNLAGLNVLTSFGGNLIIYENDILSNLTGLENLTSIEGNLIIGDYYLGGNPSIISLVGLDNLTYIGKTLLISYNAALTSLSGMDNVTSIGESFYFESNPAITSLIGLDNITTIGGMLSIWDNDALISLTGLDNVTIIGGDLNFNDNASLTSLSGMDNVTSIGGSLIINNNPVLVCLSGLDNIDAASIIHLIITYNNSLSTCEVQSICNYLSNPNGVVEIYGNATGCNNPPEVAIACGITLPCLPYGRYYFFSQDEIDNFQTNYPDCIELEGFVTLIEGSNVTSLSGLNVVTTIKGNFSIRGNDSLPDLTGLENLTSIGGGLFIGECYMDNPVLTSLTGLENLTSIGGHLSIGINPALTNLTGLNNITSIGGGLYIDYNVSLSSLIGLEKVTSIVGRLIINNNDALTSLTGLNNIEAESISDLIIINNSSLSTCEVQSVCDYLISPNGDIEIHNNATGCNSQEEVEYACGVWIPNINPESKFSIFPNPAQNKIFISGKEGVLIKEVNIYNQLGQKVVSEKQLTNVIDVSKLRQGIYVIELVSDNLRVREKLMVR